VEQSDEAEPSRPQAFGGVIGDDWRTSTPWWPPVAEPPDGAPNVLVIVLDDVGYAQLGCYGSDIPTPNIDRLADEGVRLSNFHTTALCSPTRAALLTGRNHHRNGLGRIADLAVGYPGYDGEIPIENGFLSEVLQQSGYATFAIGKWHLSPEDETHAAAPRRSWPLGRGFDRWYGFHGGETHQFVPALFADNHAITPPSTPEEGYHLSADLVDQTIARIADLRSIDPQQRFLAYLATGACHSPHHAPQEWIDRFRGHFDGGWDEWRSATFARQLDLGLLPAGTQLSPRPAWVPAWEELPPEEQRVAARFMECFAAFLSYTDDQLGRLFAFLEESGDLDDTLVVLLSDNGASSEGGVTGSVNDLRIHNVDWTSPAELVERIDELGGPTAHNNYPWGWTMAGNTPFKRWKREVHQGGVADPCIVMWRGRTEPGGIRRQFTHVVDVMPTVLDLAGIEPPDRIGYVPQSRIDGVSFASAVPSGGADAAPHRSTQYFEMFGSRAIHHDGWKAVTFKPIGPTYDDGINWNAPFAEDRWELYHVDVDPTETNDLAESEPERLADLVRRWWIEARANDVLPLDNRVLHAIVNPKPRRRPEALTSTFWPGTSPVPESVAPRLVHRGHRITAELTVPGSYGQPPEGVLLAQGSVLGGFSLHLLDGRPRYVHNLYGRARYVVAAPDALDPGDHEVVFSYEPDPDGPGGAAVLLVDGQQVASATIPSFTVSSFTLTGAGLTCGYELGPAIGEGYDAPFHCTAQLHRVRVDLSEHIPVNPMAEFERIMSEQ
jgi:arylsulfatase